MASRNHSAKHVAGRKHAIRRALERYDVDLDRRSYYEIVSIIQMSKKGLFEFIQRETCSRTHWWVQWRGVWMVAVYNSTGGHICTFLPKECAWWPGMRSSYGRERNVPADDLPSLREARD